MVGSISSQFAPPVLLSTRSPGQVAELQTQSHRALPQEPTLLHLPLVQCPPWYLLPRETYLALWWAAAAAPNHLP